MKKWQFLLTAALALLLGGALALTGCDNGTTSNSDTTGTTTPTVPTVTTTEDTEDTGDTEPTEPTEAEMNAGDFGAGVTPTTFNIPADDFTAAKTAIETAGGGNYVLNITGTVDVAGVYIELAENAIVSLRGGGTLNQTGTDGLFALEKAGSKLILWDAGLKGNKDSDNPPLVYVDNSLAEFVMHGGTITGNTGGGVFVVDGTFTMKGGEISGNTATGGGGVGIAGGTFTMSGGEISGNTATGGGGVGIEGGTFTKTGGTISGNTAGIGKEVVWGDEEGDYWIVNEPVTGPLSTANKNAPWVAFPS
ncbi:hypothetical protein AGMMS49942_16950 [Spirochaetia bacterium]|nr:hypothetical protein AGMMS49942_16950 [Spirochaetia bacterium]